MASDFTLLLQFHRQKGQDWTLILYQGPGITELDHPSTYLSSSAAILTSATAWTSSWLSLECSAERSSIFWLYKTTSLQLFYQNNFRWYCLPSSNCSCSALSVFLHCWSCEQCYIHCVLFVLFTLEHKDKNQTQGFPTCLPPTLTSKVIIVYGVRETAAAGCLASCNGRWL